MAGHGERIREIRKAAGKTQLEFIAFLFDKTGYDMSQSTLSKLETEGQMLSWEDCDALARADPQLRGREWLGWGNILPKRAQATPGVRQESSPAIKHQRGSTQAAVEAGQRDPAGASPKRPESSPAVRGSTRRRSG